MQHHTSESSTINFNNLLDRLLSINDPQNANLKSLINKLWPKIMQENKPTIIMATGGSKVPATFLKQILESRGVIAEVIEPRDYFYKSNISAFQRLMVISSSGKTNGIEFSLSTFPGEKILITSNREGTYKWASAEYLKNLEKSFVALTPSLAPILAFIAIALYNPEQDLDELLLTLKEKVKYLLNKAQNIIEAIILPDFSNIEIISGYDTATAHTILESNLVESGTCSVVIHDKGSFCHGRSNLVYQNHNFLIHLAHNYNYFDNLLLATLQANYPQILSFHTQSVSENSLLKDLYLSFQMYYLSQKLAAAKGIDLTCPDYNPDVVVKLYTYKGEM